MADGIQPPLFSLQAETCGHDVGTQTPLNQSRKWDPGDWPLPHNRRTPKTNLQTSCKDWSKMQLLLELELLNLWNKLKENTVSAESTEVFKCHLDAEWSDKLWRFDWDAPESNQSHIQLSSQGVDQQDWKSLFHSKLWFKVNETTWKWFTSEWPIK